jgi:hypothetical protein
MSKRSCIAMSPPRAGFPSIHDGEWYVEYVADSLVNIVFQLVR